MTGINKTQLWFMLGLAVFVLIALFYNQQETQRWIKTEAHITNIIKNEENLLNDRSRTYEIEYETGGKMITGQIKRASAGEYQKGDTLPVIINPDNPQDVTLPPSAELALLAMAICAIIIAGCALLLALKQRRGD